MAGVGSSSSKDIIDNLRCYHCNIKTTNFISGWQLRRGSLALLCHRCSSYYQNGIFCETFHKEFDGWRDCVACKKMLHCGCIMSTMDIHLLDYGQVCCKDCAMKFPILE